MSAPTMARTEERQEEVGEKVVWDIAGDPSWDVPRHGMRAQIIHRIEFVRHGESNANQRLTDDGDVSCDPDPQLTDRGRSQAEDVARYYTRMIGDSDPGSLRPNIETSTLRRAVHTSLPTQRLFANAPVDVNSDVRERWNKDSAWLTLPAANGEPRAIRWLCTPETLAMFRERVDGVVTRWRTTGTAQKRAHSIVFTHSLFISSVLTHLIPVASHEDEPPQFFHIPNGSITVLDFDTEGHMHVHCVGFTGHLRQPTGHHTAHVETLAEKLPAPVSALAEDVRERIQTFVSERIVEARGRLMRWAALHEEFKDWNDANYGDEAPKGIELRSAIDAKYGGRDKKANGWLNLAIKYRE